MNTPMVIKKAFVLLYACMGLLFYSILVLGNKR